MKTRIFNFEQSKRIAFYNDYKAFNVLTIRKLKQSMNVAFIYAVEEIVTSRL